MALSDEELHTLAAKKLSEERFADALEIYDMLAARGYVPCQIYAGWILFEGIGVTRQPERALVHLRKAAASGDAMGMFYLARALTITGKHDEAFEWYGRGAEMNYAPALFRVGVSHLEGLGASIDQAAAIRYLRRAASAGHVLANGQLARLYLMGRCGWLRIPVGMVFFFHLLLSAWKVGVKRRTFVDELTD